MELKSYKSQNWYISLPSILILHLLNYPMFEASLSELGGVNCDSALSQLGLRLNALDLLVSPSSFRLLYSSQNLFSRGFKIFTIIKPSYPKSFAHLHIKIPSYKRLGCVYGMEIRVWGLDFVEGGAAVIN